MVSHGLTDSIMNACRTATLGSLRSCICIATQDSSESFPMVVSVNALQVSSSHRAGVLSKPKNSTSSLSTWMLQGVCRAGVGSSLAHKKHAGLAKPASVNRRSMQSVKRQCTAVSTATPAQVQRLTVWLRA